MHLHYNLYWHNNWNLAAFFVLLVVTSAGGVLPAAFMPDINPKILPGPRVLLWLTLTSSWAFQTTLDSLPLPKYQFLKFPSLYLWGRVKVYLCQLFGAPVDPPVA